MACNCNTPSAAPAPVVSNPNLPYISQVGCLEPECPGTGTDCCTNTCLDAHGSHGAALPNQLTDARCIAPGESLTLLGRIGHVLAQFTGSGFIQIINGKASVVASVPLRLRQLWHDLWVAPGHSIPVLGAPKDFPFGVVADNLGNLYGIQGFDTKRAIHCWSFTKKVWESISPDQFPLEVSRRLSQSDGIELVGFEPISVIGTASTVRTLKALSGAGLVYLNRVATGPDDTNPACEPCGEEGFAYVATVLEFPTIPPSEDETAIHDLVFSSEGLYWKLRG